MPVCVGQDTDTFMPFVLDGDTPVCVGQDQASRLTSWSSTCCSTPCCTWLLHWGELVSAPTNVNIIVSSLNDDITHATDVMIVGKRVSLWVSPWIWWSYAVCRMWPLLLPAGVL